MAGKSPKSFLFKKPFLVVFEPLADFTADFGRTIVETNSRGWGALETLRLWMDHWKLPRCCWSIRPKWLHHGSCDSKKLTLSSCDLYSIVLAKGWLNILLFVLGWGRQWCFLFSPVFFREVIQFDNLIQCWKNDRVDFVLGTLCRNLPSRMC